LKNFSFSWILEVSVDSAQIRVENKAGYAARVLIHYQNSKGQEQLYNSGSFPILQTSVFDIEDNTKSIEIEVQMYSFISLMRTIFKTSDACPHTRCFVITGTIFKAEWNENCCQ
jgi:hypothetical protein